MSQEEPKRYHSLSEWVKNDPQIAARIAERKEEARRRTEKPIEELSTLRLWFLGMLPTPRGAEAQKELDRRMIAKSNAAPISKRITVDLNGIPKNKKYRNR